MNRHIREQFDSFQYHPSRTRRLGDCDRPSHVVFIRSPIAEPIRHAQKMNISLIRNNESIFQFPCALFFHCPPTYWLSGWWYTVHNVVNLDHHSRFHGLDRSQICVKGQTLLPPRPSINHLQPDLSSTSALHSSIRFPVIPIRTN